ncbi:MAG: putative branched-chain amino acid transport system [Acidimicrobiia bacterium]|nr:putative branched-chain amino acid transport system [Acidimicrobiia bacterium]
MKLLRIGAASFALVLIASACGDDSGKSSSSATTTAASSGGSGGTAAGAAGGASTDLLGPVNKATGTPIKVGWFDDGRSPGTDLHQDHVVADAAVAYINEHLGGIGGHPIQLDKCEGLQDVAKATDCGNQYVEKKDVAVLFSTSGNSGQIWDAVNPAGIPVVCGGCSLPRMGADAKNTFLLVNGLAGSLGFPAAYAASQGIKSIGSLVTGVPAAVDPMVLAQAAAKAVGISFDVTSVPPGAPDMTPQITAMLTKKPGMVTLVGDPAFCLTALTGLNEAGYKGVVQTADYCVNAKTLQPLPASVKTSLVVGASVAMGLPAGADKDWDLYQAIMKKYATEQPEVSGVRGWAYESVMGFYLGVTGGKIDANNVTAASVSAAMHAAPAQKLPLGFGITFKCDGQAFAPQPAYCTNGALQTSLDANGNFVNYKFVDTSASLKAIAAFMTSGGK